MRVLALVASHRRDGNTEILVKEALMGAEELGASCEIIRLTELKLTQCKACYACLFTECKLEDDGEWLIGKLRDSDALLIGTPTYLLTIPGQLKLLFDRVLSIYPRLSWTMGKPAAAIVTAGIPGWESLVLPSVYAFLYGVGYRVVGKLLAYGRGPGEVLLQQGYLEEARKLGRRLARAAMGGGVELEKESWECPICGCSLVKLTQSGAECSVCGSEIEIKPSGGCYSVRYIRGGRFIEEKLEEHLEWLRGTVVEYRKLQDRIEKLRGRYRSYKPYAKPR